MSDKKVKKYEALNNFHALAAAYVFYEKSNVNLQGGKEKTDATLAALKASKALYLELNNSNASLIKISELLEAKRIASIHFRQITGINWLL